MPLAYASLLFCAERPVVTSVATKVSSLGYLPLAPTAAPYNLITITGQYFDWSASVSIGTAACASPVVTGHSSIECTPPTLAAGSMGVVVSLVAASTDTHTMAYYGEQCLWLPGCCLDMPLPQDLFCFVS